MALTIGSTLLAENSHTTWTVNQLLGSGGQGEVYRVSSEGSELALKWYFPNQASSEQRALLVDLIQRGAPSDRFLWPKDLVSSADRSTFGYLMPLREARFHGLTDLMKRRTEPTFRALCTVCFELAHHYMLLHTQGLSYRDISFGNVFFDPNTGEVRIADNDNVCVNGTPIAGVAGTPRFMAPEIVRGEANPSTDTDLFSLAILLFYVLFMHHPLEGKREADIRCFDLPAMNRLYGSDPLFIFDPPNSSNRPVIGYQDNPLIYWPLYPQFIRDLFTRAFTDGLKPQGRVRESEWRRAMVRLRDSIMYGSKGDENFYDPDKVRAGQSHVCWNTQELIAVPPRLKIGDQVIVLTHETKLFPHHLSGRGDYDFSKHLAKVIRHPSDPSIWGMRNESGVDWSYATADGSVQTIPEGKTITLKGGLNINFGAVRGEVRI